MLDLVVDNIEEWLLALSPTGRQYLAPTRYQSYWYLSPRQHLLEYVCIVTLYLPALAWALQRGFSKPQWRNQKPIRSPNLTDILCGLVCFGAVGATFYYKFISEGYCRMPFILQPCHVLTFLLGLCCVVSSRVTSAIFQIYVTLSWSSVLAFVFPDLGDYVHMVRRQLRRLMRREISSIIGSNTLQCSRCPSTSWSRGDTSSCTPPAGTRWGISSRSCTILSC